VSANPFSLLSLDGDDTESESEEEDTQRTRNTPHSCQPSQRSSDTPLAPQPSQPPVDMDDNLFQEWMEEHGKWGHPGDSKLREIVDYYPHLFSGRMRKYVRSTVRDTTQERRCKTCVLMKGARKYRQSKRMKEKVQANREERQQRRLEHRKGKGPTKRVQFSTDTLPTSRMHEDDMLRAFAARSDRADMHIDFAHTIAIGYHQQRYYLVLVVDGKDFLWALPAKTQEDPEVMPILPCV